MTDGNLTSAVGRRELQARTGDTIHDVEVILYSPYSGEYDTWRCDYRISSYGSYAEKHASAFGADSIDALIRAMIAVDSILSARAAESPETILTWLGSSEDLGFRPK
jgi:hypothetical protein